MVQPLTPTRRCCLGQHVGVGGEFARLRQVKEAGDPRVKMAGDPSLGGTATLCAWVFACDHLWRNAVAVAVGERGGYVLFVFPVGDGNRAYSMLSKGAGANALVWVTCREAKGCCRRSRERRQLACMRAGRPRSQVRQ